MSRNNAIPSFVRLCLLVSCACLLMESCDCLGAHAYRAYHHQPNQQHRHHYHNRHHHHKQRSVRPPAFDIPVTLSVPEEADLKEKLTRINELLENSELKHKLSAMQLLADEDSSSLLPKLAAAELPGEDSVQDDSDPNGDSDYSQLRCTGHECVKIMRILSKFYEAGKRRKR